MLRGFRWQFLLLLFALVLLGAAIVLQPASTPVQSPATATVLPSPPPPPPEQASAPLPLPPANIDSPAVMREGLIGTVQRLNPLFANLNPVDRDITSLIFEGLIGTNQYGEAIPVLAENWTITSNGLEYVFRLRQDVLWQDGLMFTSADVAATVTLLQAPNSGLPETLTDFWQTIEIEILDEFTVRFRLAQPLASFLDHLRVGILPAHVFSGINPEALATHPFNLSPIGTGPYQLEHLLGDDNGISEVNLRVAPVYRQRPEGADGFALERLTFHLYDTTEAALTALQRSEIDALSNTDNASVNALEQSSQVNTHIALSPTIGLVLFNWESSHTLAFRDQRTRQALTIGADRIGLVNRHLSGNTVPADSPLIPGSWAYSGPLEWPSYDPAKATDLLADIEFAMPTATPTDEPETADAEAADSVEATPTAEPTSTPLPSYTFTLLSSDSPVQQALATDLAAQWSQLGLTVVTEALPYDQLYQRLQSGDFDTALVELSYSPQADPDPYVFWHQGQYPDGQNYSGTNDRLTSELLESARRDPNGLHRAEYYAAFQQAFVNRNLALLLYYPVYEYTVSAAVQNVQLGYLSTPADRFRSIREWSLRQ